MTTKQEWRKFRSFLEKVHNIHVKRAIREANLARGNTNKNVPESKRNLLLKECLIDKTDTAQLILLKELFFWIDLGYIDERIQAIAAVPEWWQVRSEAKRPQLVVLYGEKKTSGKIGKAVYPITLPHYEGTKSSKSPLPAYRKGQHEGILTLSDNSKVIVNAYSEAEAKKVLQAAKQAIKTHYLKGSHIKIGIRKGVELKTIEVVPVKAKYFPTGLQNLSPKWIANFR